MPMAKPEAAAWYSLSLVAGEMWVPQFVDWLYGLRERVTGCLKMGRVMRHSCRGCGSCVGESQAPPKPTSLLLRRAIGCMFQHSFPLVQEPAQKSLHYSSLVPSIEFASDVSETKQRSRLECSHMAVHTWDPPDMSRSPLLDCSCSLRWRAAWGCCSPSS